MNNKKHKHNNYLSDHKKIFNIRPPTITRNESIHHYNRAPELFSE